MDNTNVNKPTPDSPDTCRLRLGGALFVFGFLSPLLSPLLMKINLAPGWKAVLTGLLVFGIPEALMLLAAAILGKAGFAYLKAKIFGLLRKAAPPDKVGVVRYRIGLIFFVVPLLIGWLLPYFNHLWPAFDSHRQFINIAGDLLFISSFFVLGGDFWDKVRGLFVHNSRITFE